MPRLLFRTSVDPVVRIRGWRRNFRTWHCRNNHPQTPSMDARPFPCTAAQRPPTYIGPWSEWWITFSDLPQQPLSRKIGILQDAVLQVPCIGMNQAWPRIARRIPWLLEPGVEILTNSLSVEPGLARNRAQTQPLAFQSWIMTIFPSRMVIIPENHWVES